MIRRLEWDSRHFGLEIGRVDGDTLSEAAVGEIAGECERFDCVYLLADADHIETAERAHQLGFHMVDVRVTLARALDEISDPMTDDDTIRPATASDLPQLEELAAGSYRSTRFYFDPRFERDRVDELYRIWLRNEYHSASATVLVVDGPAGAAGYTSCSVRGADADVGLVAVGETIRGTGKALLLMSRAQGWAAGRGATRIAVVTQARNVAAIRLYERAGFRYQSVRVWYHRWRR